MAQEQTRPTSGSAIVAIALAIAAVLAFSWTLIAVTLSLGAIVAALRSRHDLRQQPELRGAVLGVVSLIVGLGVLCLILLPGIPGFIATTMTPHP